MPAYTVGDLLDHIGGLARATGQPEACDPASLEAVHGFVAQFPAPGMEEPRAGLFGPVVTVPDDAPLVDRVIGMAGRDPGRAAP